MFVRGITLSIAAIFAVGLMAETADADHDRTKPRRIIIEDGYYPGPPIIREIPGLRILFGDYALSAEEFDELYGTPRRAYRYDEEPEPRKTKRKVREREQQKQKQQQQKSKAAAKPAKPAEPKKTAAKTAASSGLSCEKATSVVTGYGFSGVTPSSCSGKVYAFNATRDGKSFAIKLNSANGELTEVKKLP
jgi:hypothetical protein